MAATEARPTGGGASSPLVGRDREVGALREALARARGGAGETWTLVGQGGMGKTRLLRWLEEEARTGGFEVRSGTCLKESLSPFFPFEQIFRMDPPGGSSPGAGAGGAAWPQGLPTLGLLEEPRPKTFWSTLEALPIERPLLVVTRERPTSLRTSRPSLQRASGILWITRVEGPDHISPGDLDGLAHRAEEHFRSAPGAVVALEGLEYLVSQGEFSPVLRLVQFLRDTAQETDGHLLLTLNPAAFGMREVSLLESDADVQRVAPATPGATVPISFPPAERLLRYLASLEAASRRSAQVLVLDDMQWADAASASAFQFLARNLTSLPVLLVGALREETDPAPEGGRPPIEEIRENLQRAGLVRRLALQGLGEGEAGRLATGVLGTQEVEFVPPSAGASLVRRTGGNPYFLREIFLQLDEDGRVRRQAGKAIVSPPDPRSTSGTGALPETVRRLVARRLSSLPPAARKFLEVGALSGSEFDPAPVAAVLDLDAASVRQNLELLHRERRLIEPVGKLWSCAHPLVWEVTLSEMEPNERRRQARELCEWWATHRPQETDNLARLAYEAGDAKVARPWLLRAVAEACERFSAEAATVYLRWMREMRRAQGGPPDWDALRKELDLARDVSALGRPALARDAMASLLEENPPPAVKVEVLIILGWTNLDIDGDETERRVLEAFSLAEKEPSILPPVLRARGLLARGFAASHRREFARSVEFLRQAEPLIPPDGPIRIRAELYLELSFDESQLDHLEPARVALEKGFELAKATQNPVAMGIALNSRGALFARGGDLAKGYEDFVGAALCSRQRGHVNGYCIALSNACEMLAYLGDEERAERLAKEALEVARKFSLDRPEAGALGALARIASFQARWPGARRWAEEAMRTREGLRRDGASVATRLVMAQVRAHDPADLEGGRQALLEWLSVPTAEVEETIDAHRALAEVDARLGRFDEAKAELEKVRALLPQRENNRFLEYRLRLTELQVAELQGLPEEAERLRRQLPEAESRMRSAWPADSAAPAAPAAPTPP